MEKLKDDAKYLQGLTVNRTCTAGNASGAAFGVVAFVALVGAAIFLMGAS